MTDAVVSRRKPVPLRVVAPCGCMFVYSAWANVWHWDWCGADRGYGFSQQQYTTLRAHPREVADIVAVGYAIAWSQGLWPEGYR